jgi:hypothetical protein
LIELPADSGLAAPSNAGAVWPHQIFRPDIGTQGIPDR